MTPTVKPEIGIGIKNDQWHRVRSRLLCSTDNVWLQLFRYTLVGAFAFFVDFVTLYGLTEFLHIHYLRSAALAFVAGLTTNYFLSIVWVFNKRSIANRWFEFLVFAALGIVGLGLNEITMYLLTELGGFYYLVSKIGATVLTYAWNFASRKLLLFTVPVSSVDVPLQKVSSRSMPDKCLAKHRTDEPSDNLVRDLISCN